MLSQFKIGARLGGAFAVILLLLLAASGTGLFSVTRIADTTREALETDGALASNAGVVRRLALELRRYEKDVFINLADFQALNGYFGKWSDTVTRLKSVLDEGEALAVVITRSITLPLADALGVARRIAQGDLRERIVARGRDEPAQLLAAMAEMSDSLVKLVSALRGASET
ncbi:MAG: HAMP domain-containing protein, partial [Alloalcanivorax venustensis]|uniref:HAMP domain-containing protein n=1 Tax=Alloalcanivorax venustensis TaxID=172371 RepID=UPI003C32C8DC